jgi:selenocysteine lyase/cysteine desulfurase
MSLDSGGELHLTDADFYTGNTEIFTGNSGKWLGSQRASGFLAFRPEVQHLLQPLVVSWGWEPNEVRDDAKRAEVEHPEHFQVSLDV